MLVMNNDNITDEDISNSFKPTKEERIITNILSGRSPHSEGLYSKEERLSLKRLEVAIQKIRHGQATKCMLENMKLSTKVVCAICKKEGIKVAIISDKIYIGGD